MAGGDVLFAVAPPPPSTLPHQHSLPRHISPTSRCIHVAIPSMFVALLRISSTHTFWTTGLLSAVSPSAPWLPLASEKSWFLCSPRAIMHGVLRCRFRTESPTNTEASWEVIRTSHGQAVISYPMSGGMRVGSIQARGIPHLDAPLTKEVQDHAAMPYPRHVEAIC